MLLISADSITFFRHSSFKYWISTNADLAGRRESMGRVKA